MKQCTRLLVVAHTSRWCVVSRSDSRSPSDFSASTSKSALAGAVILTSHVSCGTAVISKRAVERPRARRSTASWGRTTNDPNEAGVETAVFGCGAEAVEWLDPQLPISSAPVPAISKYMAMRTRRTLLRASPRLPRLAARLPEGVSRAGWGPRARARSRDHVPPAPDGDSRRTCRRPR